MGIDWKLDVLGLICSLRAGWGLWNRLWEHIS